MIKVQNGKDDLYFGTEEGEVCGRNLCKGVIKLEKPDNCSCHISPPCSACTNCSFYCPVCLWREEDEYQFNDFTVTEHKGVFRTYTPRQLDESKIDWRSGGHTNFTMIKEGVYPPGTTKEEVRKVVDGTFGGRFEYFDAGRFKFIAYTD